MIDVRDPSCESCPLVDAVERRDFLREVIAQTLVAIGAFSVFADRAMALPVTFVRGIGSGADKAYALPAADSVSIDKDESVIIARFNNRAFSFSLACPHQN